MVDTSAMVDFANQTLVCKDIAINATVPGGSTGTNLSTTELAYLDGVTAGTATASKALVLSSGGSVATITAATFTAATVTTLTPTTVAGTPAFSGVTTFQANPALSQGVTLSVGGTVASLTSNAATITPAYSAVITTEALTTATGGSQALTITIAGVAPTDMIFLTRAGGTNTTRNFQLDAAPTSNTATVTVYNTSTTASLNGTIKFNLWVVKP